MLLTCSSCNSRYLINSADLQPNGRTVRCAKCYNEWFQEPNLVEEEVLKPSSLNNFNEEKTTISNLPSTYIKGQTPSIINSIIVLIFLVLAVVLFWFIKKEGVGLIALLNFYIQEFYFNLKLIVNDLAKLIHQVINL